MEFASLVAQEPMVSQGPAYDLKEQVRQAIDIVDLVGSFIPLRRQGRNYVGLCPWHDDSRPSFQVNQERQSWKCWVCDLGGDVFSFLMQMEGITFPEALAMLAERANISLKPIQRHSHSHAAEGESESPEVDKRSLLRAMAWAEDQYHECLVKMPDGEPGRKYLADREISAESIEKFHLGYSPDTWDWILHRAEAVRANAKLLESVGILVRSAGGGRPYDRFRGRVLFSIRDTQGRPVGIGGRILPGASSPAKYVNSPETPLFRKSSLLYGLDVARDAVRKSREVLVMEGNTDCIMAHQFGFNNAVAILGTALGESHLKILKRFADRIILVLDGDAAGQKRANEVLSLFVAEQVDLRIVTLPPGEEKDPCDFLLKHGADAFGELIEKHAVDALEHAFQTATRGLDLDRDVHGATQALDYLISIIAKSPRHRDDTTHADRLREEKILQRLAARFRIDESEIRRQVTELRRKQSGRLLEQLPKADDDNRQPDAWERELLEILIQNPDQLPRAQEAIVPERILSRLCRRIYSKCCELADAGVIPAFERLMLEFDDAATKNLLVALDEDGRAKGVRVSDPGALIEAIIAGYQKREALRHRPAQTVALREGQMNEDQQLQLLQQIFQQERARQGISPPTDE